MSIRQYRPRIADRRAVHTRQLQIASIFLTLVIFQEILYPLVHGGLLRILTITIVYTAAITVLAHALFSYGAKYFWIYLFSTSFAAYGIELLGSKSGWPFGHYTYSPTLGAAILGVPVVVPFAWIMMVHPILVSARKISTHWTFLIGGLGIAIWDLFLDPQMVSAGRWTWEKQSHHVPWEPSIPLSNFAGWMLCGMALIAILNRILPKERRKHGSSTAIMDLFLVWVLFSGVVGNIFFFHTPGVALIAGVPFALYLGIYLFNSRITKPD
jgi:putative membrane protein